MSVKLWQFGNYFLWEKLLKCVCVNNSSTLDVINSETLQRYEVLEHWRTYGQLNKKIPKLLPQIPNLVCYLMMNNFCQNWLYCIFRTFNILFGGRRVRLLLFSWQYNLHKLWVSKFVNDFSTYLLPYGNHFKFCTKWYNKGKQVTYLR